jgi:hypothetical protein
VSKEIASLAKEDEMVRLLMTIPGIGYYSALLIVSEIVDINSGNENLRLSAQSGQCNETPTQMTVKVAE